jgi:leader peptidase (prepilin peptidase) / N-methyltransferase
MNLFIYIVIFLFGLIIGSFINCLIYRLRNKKSLNGRSFCPHCKKQINWYDNIPLLSFFILKGKCRKCKKTISFEYPLVELVTAITFILIYHFASLSVYTCSIVPLLTLFRNWLFASILIVIFIYDFKYYLILDKVSIPAIILALIVNLFIAFLNTGFNSLISEFLNLALSAIVAGGFFFLQFAISRGKWIGGGDIRLGLLMGFMLGWPYVLPALAISYILGSLVGMFLIGAKHANMKTQVPLGTFLAIGIFIVLIWGSQIVNWYLTFTFY